MIKFKDNKKVKIDADTWVWDNIEELVEKYAGGYIVVVNDHGLVFTDADGRPGELTRKAGRKYPGKKVMFFRVPHPQDFLCALILR